MSEATRAGSAPPHGFEALFERYGPSYRWMVTVTALIGTVATILSSTIVTGSQPSTTGTVSSISNTRISWTGRVPHA